MVQRLERGFDVCVFGQNTSPLRDSFHSGVNKYGNVYDILGAEMTPGLYAPIFVMLPVAIRSWPYT